MKLGEPELAAYPRCRPAPGDDSNPSTAHHRPYGFSFVFDVGEAGARQKLTVGPGVNLIIACTAELIDSALPLRVIEHVDQD